MAEMTWLKNGTKEWNPKSGYDVQKIFDVKTSETVENDELLLILAFSGVRFAL